jgi:hypothetical protein
MKRVAKRMIFTVPEIAVLTDYTRNRIWQKLNEMKVPIEWHGGIIIVSREDLLKYFKKKDGTPIELTA